MRRLSCLLALALLSGPAVAQNTVITYVDANGVRQPVTPNTPLPIGDRTVAAAGNRIITKQTITANTSTVICPAPPSPPVKVEIQISGAGLGLGINGQTLTSGPAIGVSASAPDLQAPSALTFFVFVVPPNNAITGYGPSQVVVCIQTLR